MRQKRTKILAILCVVIMFIFVMELRLDGGHTYRLLTTLLKVLQNKGTATNGYTEGSREEQLRQHMSAISRGYHSKPSEDQFITLPDLPGIISHYSKEGLRNCSPTVDASNIRTAFKFYIYNLPSKFNHDIQRQLTDVPPNKYWYNLDYCGMGEALDEGDQQGQSKNVTDHFGVLSVRNTHQFALGVIIHHKLLHSPYRTLDPQQADMFYIPAYTGLNCAQRKGDSGVFVRELFEYLETEETMYYKSGKPHFATLSKIQKEQCLEKCQTLKHPATQNVTFFTIEKEINPNWPKNHHAYGTSIIVAPYPSYIHLTNDGYEDKSLYETISNGLTNLTQSKFRLKVPSLSERNVTLFLASSFRRNNKIRIKLVEHFRIKTSLHPDKFFQGINGTVSEVMLITTRDTNNHSMTTAPWMQRSVFCLQPPGDSPTRKSFYDSILSGCIPILFTHPSGHRVEYPFQKYLNYDTFSYTVDEKLISRYHKNIYKIIKAIPDTKVIELHENLLKVAKWFQYSLPHSGIQWEDDAMTLLLHQVTSLYNLTSIPISKPAKYSN